MKIRMYVVIARINTTTHQCSMVDVPPVANVWEEFTTSKKNVDKSCAMI
jgi:hypothetical protein